MRTPTIRAPKWTLPRAAGADRRPRPLARILAGTLSLAAVIGIVATAGAVTAGSQQVDVPAPPRGWTTVFSDDFNGPAGTGVDPANWLYDTGTGYQGGAVNWGTGEVETATSSTSNVFHDGNGHLVIRPIRDASGQWTSGRVETRRTDFAAPAGGELEFSASIKQPNPVNGVGYWPAFWMLGAGARPTAATNWPSIGELDAMEDVNGLNDVSNTFHCGVDPGGPCNETNGVGSGLQTCHGCQTGYHTYSMIVDRTNTSAEQLRYYLDGAQTFAINENQVDTATWRAAVDHGFFAIFDLAVGGAYPDKVCGCTSPSPATTSGAGMSVDWFAVYQTSGGSSGQGERSAARPPAGSRHLARGYLPASSYGGASLGSARIGTATGDTDPPGASGSQVDQLSGGAYLRYDNVNFGSTGSSQFQARVASGAANGVSGLVEVVLDNPSNPPIGSFAVASTGGWTSWRTIPANISCITGTHTVYLVLNSGARSPYVSLHWLSFPAH